MTTALELVGAFLLTVTLLTAAMFLMGIPARTPRYARR
jgi:hypothetical protein